MKVIKNTSNYDTTQLKKVFSMVYSFISRKEGKLGRWNGLKVLIVKRNYSRRYSGYAYYSKQYHGEDMKLRLGKDLNLKTIAQLFGHELMHCYGFKHGKFQDEPLNDNQVEAIRTHFKGVNFSKVIKAKEPTDYVPIRYSKLKERLKSWERKYKFARTNLKKVKNKIKRYEKEYNSERLVN